MNLYQVLDRPLISEKSTTQRESGVAIAFRIHRDATKDEVKKALQVIYGVDVESVRTVNHRGKIRRRGRHISRVPDRFKKAFVRLKEGQKLPIFEDA